MVSDQKLGTFLLNIFNKLGKLEILVINFVLQIWYSDGKIRFQELTSLSASKIVSEHWKCPIFAALWEDLLKNTGLQGVCMSFFYPLQGPPYISGHSISSPTAVFDHFMQKWWKGAIFLGLSDYFAGLFITVTYLVPELY